MDLPRRIYLIKEVERLWRDLLAFVLRSDDVVNDSTVSGNTVSDALDYLSAHAVTFGTPGTIQPDDSASAGVATTAARSDHRHAIVAAAPGSIVPGDVASEGSATSFARSDHTHAQALEDQYLGIMAAISINGWPR